MHLGCIGLVNTMQFYSSGLEGLLTHLQSRARVMNEDVRAEVAAAALAPAVVVAAAARVAVVAAAVVQECHRRHRRRCRPH